MFFKNGLLSPPLNFFLAESQYPICESMGLYSERGLIDGRNFVSAIEGAYFREGNVISEFHGEEVGTPISCL